jgi:hypothetical protein
MLKVACSLLVHWKLCDIDSQALAVLKLEIVWGTATFADNGPMEDTTAKDLNCILTGSGKRRNFDKLSHNW